MPLRNLLWLMMLSQCAMADVFVIELFDTTGAVIINTTNPTGTRCNDQDGCNLHAQELGVFSMGTVGGNHVFGEPGNNEVGAVVDFLLNNPPSGSETEIYIPVPTNPSNPGFFFDFTPPGQCGPGECTQNGTEYYLGDLNYTDGSTDAFYFAWFVAGEPIAAPEPTGVLLLGTVIIGIGIFSRQRRFTMIGGSTVARELRRFQTKT